MIVVRCHYWLCTDTGRAGNAIDFFTQVEGKIFRQAMQVITQWLYDDAAKQNFREVHGNEAKILR